MYILKLVETTRHLPINKIETSIDEKKNKSNRLISICGKYYTVITSDGETLEFVGKRAFNKWAKDNEYVTDF